MFEVLCDVSTGAARPFITIPFRKIAFDSLHKLSHPGAKATIRLVTQKFVWPSIKADCRKWVKTCLECQRSKITRHVTMPVGKFPLTSKRFQHVHMDIVVMPYSEGFRYCLTMVDRFTRWPEAVPLINQEAVTVARVFYETWIARFGVPMRVTTDQGRQFESHVFKHLNELMGSTHLHTTAYHPAANGMVERLHRQLKASLRCHNISWTKALPAVLLGIRSAWKEDIKSSAAEMIYGQTLSLPGEFFTTSTNNNYAEPFVKELREYFKTLKPTDGSKHGEPKIFIFKDLKEAKYVFVRNDAVKAPLQNPYNGPYRVIERADYFFKIDIDGKATTISVNRLKPAFIESDLPSEVTKTTEPQDNHIIHNSVPNNLEALPEDQEQYNRNSMSDSQNQAEHIPKRTRSGRIVKFPDKFRDFVI